MGNDGLENTNILIKQDGLIKYESLKTDKINKTK